MSDNQGLSTPGIDALLSQTRQALEQMRPSDSGSGDAGGAREPSEPLRGEGTAADGRVRAVVAAPGELETFEMDPRVLRDGSEAVCAAVTAAVNAALQDLRHQAVTTPAGVDFDQLSGDLERMQEESLESARTMFTALQDVMDRIERRT